ncbi:hypothetical protein [Alienimonas chondri]|uniref:Uncharacterized protein n=1 Tax=Alienimonas chondri TaxID=2681879 RepID=A0ABX1VD45_9PLAN|nr:hypothetical protein [Alienimonas chondri]NNJ25157.1 hypothetical protein [Alienimonas chondri]
MPDPPSRGDDWAAGVLVGWPLGITTAFAPFALLALLQGDGPAGVLCGAIVVAVLIGASLPFGLLAGWASIRFRDARGATWPATWTAAVGSYLVATAFAAAGLLSGLLT